ncbi:MAG: TonB family protein [Magnetococcales bacterium]|nr:TonB family protein [Magnetococcales bacterium]
MKPEPKKPEPVKPEPVKPEPVKPEPVKPEPKKPDPNKAEKEKLESDRAKWGDIIEMLGDDYAEETPKKAPTAPLQAPAAPVPAPAAPVAAPAAPASALSSAPVITSRPQASRLQVAMYQQQVQEQVRLNWNKPGGLLNEDQLAVTVTVKVAPDGRLYEPRVTRASGNPVFDRSVLIAISKTLTPPAPPQGCPECQMIEFNFLALE